MRHFLRPSARGGEVSSEGGIGGQKIAHFVGGRFATPLLPQSFVPRFGVQVFV